MSRHIIHILSIIFFLACGQRTTNNEQTSAQTPSFTPPTPPLAIQDDAERSLYVAMHYWDDFPFADSSYVSNKEKMNIFFNDYLHHLLYAPRKEYTTVVHRSLNKALAVDSIALTILVNGYEALCNNPNSPLRNEEIMIAVMEYVVASTAASQEHKLRYKQLLPLALRNRVGTPATNFHFLTKSGVAKRLYDIHTPWIIIYFNNPGCHDCVRVSELLRASQVLNNMISADELTILSIYPDEEIDLWKKTEYPKSWVNGYDANQLINKKQLYDLRAIPSLYLLDSKKKVVFKDAPFEMIERHFVH